MWKFPSKTSRDWIALVETAYCEVATREARSTNVRFPFFILIFFWLQSHVI